MTGTDKKAPHETKHTDKKTPSNIKSAEKKGPVKK
jgi:hypothetical protein